MDNKQRLLAFSLCGLVGLAHAGEKEELLKLRNTTTNLIKELVKQGVITEKVADEMIKRAEADAEKQVASQTKAGAVDTTPAEPGEVRVPYVPDFVKDEIRQQVRSELRADVTQDVIKEAKTQQWGVPSALPEWINRFKLSGDLRLRSQGDYMGAGNAKDGYINYAALNGGAPALGSVSGDPEQDFYNTTTGRQWFRERFRLGIDAKINDNLKTGIRLATGNIQNPVSTNQTLGNYGGQYQFNLDRAFLKYEAVDSDGYKWLTVAGGRTQNPWFVGGGEFTGGSELVWDADLSFEGLYATARHNLFGADGISDSSDSARSLFFTMGAFPLQDSIDSRTASGGINNFSQAQSSHNKWMFGGQTGLEWAFDNQDVFSVAAAYYDYQNIKASLNNTASQALGVNGGQCSLNNANNNQSVPQFMQGGNSLVAICDNGNFTGLAGLASDFKIINVNGNYNMALFAPYHIVLGADYAKNVGTIASNFQSRLLNPGLNSAINPVNSGTNAWQVRMDAGWPKVDRNGHWNVFAQYRYIESNAVLDAYTDSDFHLGGTNAKGWSMGGNYGIMKNTWLTGRWLSTSVITGPQWNIDTLQLDINTKF